MVQNTKWNMLKAETLINELLTAQGNKLNGKASWKPDRSSVAEVVFQKKRRTDGDIVQ